MWGWKKKKTANWETEAPGRAWKTTPWHDAWATRVDPSRLNVAEQALLDAVEKRLSAAERETIEEQKALLSAVRRHREPGAAVSRFEGLGVHSGATPFRQGYPENLLGAARLVWDGGMAEARIELVGGRLNAIHFAAAGVDGQPFPPTDFDIESVQIFR